MIGALIRKARALAAWMDSRQGAFPRRLLDAICAQFAWRRGRREAAAIIRQNAAAFAGDGDAERDAQSPPADRTADNTLIVVAAYASTDHKVACLVHNLRRLTAYSRHILVYDAPANLTDSAVKKIQSVDANIRICPKATEDMLDHWAFNDALTADDKRYDYYLIMNDSTLIVGDMADFFRQAPAAFARHDAFALLATAEEGYPTLVTSPMILNRKSAMAYKKFYSAVTPAIRERVAKCRHPNAAYREYYRYALIVGTMEIGISPHLRGRAMVTATDDKRMVGINFYLGDADLFRDYLENKNYPVIKMKQIGRRGFSYLDAHIPPALRRPGAE